MKQKRVLCAILVALSLLVVAAFWVTSSRQSEAVVRTASALEESGNIDLAIRLTTDLPGTSLVGEPTAIYGINVTFRNALERFESSRVLGVGHEWKYDQVVYAYLFEGDFDSADERLTNDKDPWVQMVVMIDAETGESFGRIAKRESVRIDTSDLEVVRRLP